jgi:dUTP pyrophosphatase
MIIDIKVLADNDGPWIKHPTYMKAVLNRDVGLDIPLLENVTIPANVTSYKIPLRIATAPSRGYMLIPRSSIIKTSLRLANSVGIIDQSYRGELVAVVDNLQSKEVNLRTGECYFQIVAFDGLLPSFKLVNQLDQTIRGKGGFGSTTS